MKKKIAVLGTVIALCVAGSAAAISLDRAVVIGQQYLSKSYALPLASVKAMEADRGGVQAIRDPQGWQIWYWPPLNGGTQSHIVLVRQDGSAVELNKKISARITEAEGAKIVRDHLLKRKIVTAATNVRASRQGAGFISSAETGYAEFLTPIPPKPLNLKKIAERPATAKPDATIPSEPLWDYNTYFETKTAGGVTTFAIYTVSVNATTKTVPRVEKKRDCNFKNLTSEAKAMEAFRNQTGKVARGTELNGCTWSLRLQNPDGTHYMINDNATITTSGRSYGQGSVDTDATGQVPIVTKPKKTFFQWLFGL